MNRFIFRVKVAVAVSLSVIFLGFLLPSTATAAGSQVNQGAIIINPGGGVQSNGSDGIKAVFNGVAPLSSYTGSDQLYFANTYQWCCGGSSPQLNVNGTLIGEAGASSFGSIDWDSISVQSSSGAVEILQPGDSTSTSTATGNAQVTIRYQKTLNGLNYLVDRAITYTYPNNFYTENYTFTIPAGNTGPVKFYQGGDASPGSSDQGSGFSVTTPTVAAYEVNTSSGIYISYQQTIGGIAFDGLWASSYSGPYTTIAAGGDIGFVTTTSIHDAGLDMQWTLGSTPGTYTRSMITQGGFQSTQVTAAFDSNSGTAGQSTNFTFQIVNTNFSAQSNLSFSAVLPAGLTISGQPTNTCSGTLTANNGSSSMSISGASVASGSNCSITLPVTGAAGSYSWSDQTTSVSNPLEKGYSTSTLVLTGSATPSPNPTLPATGTHVASSNDEPYFALLLLGSGILFFLLAVRGKRQNQ